MIDSNKRFLIALSFPGEHREFVEEVAKRLAAELGQERVLYDKFHEAEFARRDLDVYLQNLYHNSSDLIVVFLGTEYERKEWCGLEWRAIRDLIKKKYTPIMFIRFDVGDVSGSFSIDGYIDARGRSPEEITKLILERLQNHETANESVQDRPLISGRPLWHVPSAPDPLFKGREAELQLLHDTAKLRTSRRVVQVLSGLPGLGKTSIAVEYAHRFRNDYVLIWWLDASDESSLLRGFQTLAKRLDERFDQHNLSVLDCISAALSNFPDWLLIFDNVPLADNFLSRLPKTATGQILITSSDRNWQARAMICDVLPLDPSAAIAFLNERLRGMPAAFDRELVPKLATELSFIPAALESASVYLELTGCTIGDYLHALNGFRRRSFRDFGDIQNVELEVARTWLLLIIRAQCECIPAWFLLRLVQWFDDCEIPTDFLTQTDLNLAELLWHRLSIRIIFIIWVLTFRRRLGPPQPPLPPFRVSRFAHTFSEALIKLERYSIIKRSKSSFAIPAVIKVYIRVQQPKIVQKRWYRVALIIAAECAKEAFARGDHESGALWIRHLRKAIENSALLDPSSVDEDIKRARQALDELEGTSTIPTPLHP